MVIAVAGFLAERISTSRALLVRATIHIARAIQLKWSLANRAHPAFCFIHPASTAFGQNIPLPV